MSPAFDRNIDGSSYRVSVHAQSSLLESVAGSPFILKPPCGLRVKF